MCYKMRINKESFLMALAFFVVLTVIVPTSGICTSYSFLPTDDAMVAWSNSIEEYYADPNTNYNDYYLGVGNWLEVGNLKNTIRYSYLKFDLSSIPSNETITAVTLNLYCILVNRPDSPGMVDLHYVPNNSWLETTITWNNQPGYDSLVLSSQDKDIGWRQWTVDPTVITGQVLSLALTYNQQGLNMDFFDSKDLSPSEDWKPYLSVTTQPVPEPATMLLLGSGLIGLAGYGRKILFKK